MLDIVFEQENSRAAAYLDGRLVGEATLDMRDGLWVLDHTGVHESARGRGIAALLVAKAVEAARAAGVKMDPQCSYARAEFDRHAEYQDLL